MYVQNSITKNNGKRNDDFLHVIYILIIVIEKSFVIIKYYIQWEGEKHTHFKSRFEEAQRLRDVPDEPQLFCYNLTENQVQN